MILYCIVTTLCLDTDTVYQLYRTSLQMSVVITDMFILVQANSVFLSISLMIAYKMKRKDLTNKVSRIEATRYATYLLCI